MMLKISISSMIIICLFSWSTIYLGDQSRQHRYEQAVALAKKTEDRLPFVSANHYKAAIQLNPEKITLHMKYLAQIRQLGNHSLYLKRVNTFINQFPDRPEGYELLCEKNVQDKNYSKVLEIIHLAKSRNVSSKELSKYQQLTETKYVILKNGFESAYSFSGKTALVKVKEGWRFLNTHGEFLFDAIYQKADLFINDIAAIQDTQWKLINSGTYSVAVIDHVEKIFTPSETFTLMVQNKKYGFSQSFSLPKNFPWDYATSFHHGVAAVQRGGKWGLLNHSQTVFTGMIYDDVKITETNFCSGQGILFVQKAGKYHMIDTNGNSLSKAVFDDAVLFASAEPAAIKQGEKWGFVDHSGKIFLKPWLTEAKSFSYGLAPAKVGSKWGYVNLSGKMVIEPVFDDCQSFSTNGIAAVKQGEKWGYIQLIKYR